MNQANTKHRQLFVGTALMLVVAATALPFALLAMGPRLPDVLSNVLKAMR